MSKFSQNHPGAIETQTLTTLRRISADINKYIALTERSFLEAIDHSLDADHCFDQGISLPVEVYQEDNRAVLKDSDGWF